MDAWELSIRVTGTWAFWAATRAIPNPYRILVALFLSLEGTSYCQEHTDHLPSSYHTQRLNLGGMDGGGGAEGPRGQ